MSHALMRASKAVVTAARFTEPIHQGLRLLHGTAGVRSASRRPSSAKPGARTGTPATAAVSNASVSAVDEPIPSVARYLGLASTIPFFASAGTAAFAPEMASMAGAACAAYGSAVLSFLGAVHWGVALRAPAESSTRTWDFAYSVCPPLGAASAAALPTPEALALLLPSFGVALIYDAARFAGDKAVPRWYPTLRRPLTAAAMTASGVCLAALWLPEEPGAKIATEAPAAS